MEQTALLLIIITLFILVIIVGLLTVLIYKMFRNNTTPASYSVPPTGEAPHPDVSKADFHPAIIERLKELEKLKPKRSDLFCPNHREEPGEVMCAICDKIYCKSCIKPFKTLHFCKEHIPLVMRYDWDEVITIKTSTHDPEKGVRLYDVKKEIFENKNIPTYIETHYKINVDSDYIETYLVMFGIKDSVEEIRKILPDNVQ